MAVRKPSLKADTTRELEAATAPEQGESTERGRRLLALKQAIEAGTYKVPADKVAGKLLDRLMPKPGK